MVVVPTWSLNFMVCTLGLLVVACMDTMASSGPSFNSSESETDLSSESNSSGAPPSVGAGPVRGPAQVWQNTKKKKRKKRSLAGEKRREEKKKKGCFCCRVLDRKKAKREKEREK
jgi:hypothetical protein